MTTTSDVDEWVSIQVCKIRKNYSQFLREIYETVTNNPTARQSTFTEIKDTVRKIMQELDIEFPVNMQTSIRLSFLMTDIIECALVGEEVFDTRARMRLENHNRATTTGVLRPMTRQAIEKIILELAGEKVNFFEVFSELDKRTARIGNAEETSFLDQRIMSQIDAKMRSLDFPLSVYSTIDVLKAIRNLHDFLKAIDGTPS